MKKGICKVCKEEKMVDICNYCNECYPYDKSCDRYKDDLISDAIGCRHPNTDERGYCSCGVYVKQKVAL